MRSLYHGVTSLLFKFGNPQKISYIKIIAFISKMILTES